MTLQQQVSLADIYAKAILLPEEQDPVVFPTAQMTPIYLSKDTQIIPSIPYGAVDWTGTAWQSTTGAFNAYSDGQALVNNVYITAGGATPVAPGKHNQLISTFNQEDVSTSALIALNANIPQVVTGFDFNTVGLINVPKDPNYSTYGMPQYGTVGWSDIVECTGGSSAMIPYFDQSTNPPTQPWPFYPVQFYEAGGGGNLAAIQPNYVAINMTTNSTESELTANIWVRDITTGSWTQLAQLAEMASGKYAISRVDNINTSIASLKNNWPYVSIDGIAIRFGSYRACSGRLNFTLQIGDSAGGTNCNLRDTANTLQTLDCTYANNFDVQSCVCTARSLRLTSLAAEISDAGSILCGALNSRVRPGNLPGANLSQQLGTVHGVYSGAHKDGAYVFLRPEGVPYEMATKFERWTTRMNILIAVTSSTRADHKLTMASHFMSTTNNEMFSTSKPRIVYEWYELLCKEINRAPLGTGNMSHEEMAKNIYSLVNNDAVAAVGDFLAKGLGTITPRGERALRIGSKVFKGGANTLASVMSPAVKAQNKERKKKARKSKKLLRKAQAGTLVIREKIERPRRPVPGRKRQYRTATFNTMAPDEL